MENTNTKPSSLQFVMKTGLLLGGLQIVFQLIEYFTGQKEKGGNAWMGGIFIVLYGVIGVVLLKKFRNNQLGGYITFGKAFSITLQFLVVAGILSTLFEFVFIHLLHPAIIEATLKVQEAKLVTMGIPDATIESQMKMSRMMITNPAIFIIMGIVSSAIFGVIVGLIAGAICKKETYNNIVSE